MIEILRSPIPKYLNTEGKDHARAMETGSCFRGSSNPSVTKNVFFLVLHDNEHKGKITTIIASANFYNPLYGRTGGAANRSVLGAD